MMETVPLRTYSNSRRAGRCIGTAPVSIRQRLSALERLQTRAPTRRDHGRRPLTPRPPREMDHERPMPYRL
jgi:hypothetical protein